VTQGALHFAASETVDGQAAGSNDIGCTLRTLPDRYRGATTHRFTKNSQQEEAKMKLSIALAAAVLTTGFVTASSKPASAIIYCSYVGYPVGCVARAGVVLRPRPVARAAVRHNAGGNLNGGVNRVGVRR
jgi:hypothetical protein